MIEFNLFYLFEFVGFILVVWFSDWFI